MTKPPFREVKEFNKDAVVYCPKCSTTEVEMIAILGFQLDIITRLDHEGLQASQSRTPVLDAYDDKPTPWQAVLQMQCGNGHHFDLTVFTKRGLTWMEVRGDPASELASQ